MKIKAILFDVDGVLTDGKITYDNNGFEIKSFNVKDGQLVKFMQHQGYLLGAISGRSSPALERRMNEMKVDFFRAGSKNKHIEYVEFKTQFNLQNAEIAYIGDDIIDLVVLRQVGLAIAPADAVELIKKSCSLITKSKGGEGVLREVLEYFIVEHNLEQVFNQYYNLTPPIENILG